MPFKDPNKRKEYNKLYSKVYNKANRDKAYAYNKNDVSDNLQS